jgi:membrane associated rhomboid family serine protease
MSAFTISTRATLGPTAHIVEWRGRSGGLLTLSDASRRPGHLPIVTVCIILTNLLVFVLELSGGDAFVLKWAAIPANITAGHHWITILTAMVCRAVGQ